MPKITKKLIDSLEAKDKDYIIWDDKISGFGVKITKAGRKVYLLKYRAEDGRQRKPSIGGHGKTLEEKMFPKIDRLRDNLKQSLPYVMNSWKNM